MKSWKWIRSVVHVEAEVAAQEVEDVEALVSSNSNSVKLLIHSLYGQMNYFNEYLSYEYTTRIRNKLNNIFVCL